MATAGNQKQAFLKGEGDAYLRRNAGRERIGNDDPVVRVVRRLKLGGTSVLEVGCGPCDRLAMLQEADRDCFGIDPSVAAVRAAQQSYPQLTLEVGTADVLPFPTDRFDLVIFGFCLYLVDPEDMFSVAREADRVLKDHGTLLIHDFCTPRAYANTYSHHGGIVSRKMEWSRMFTWNPAYSLVHRELSLPNAGTLHDVDARTTVDVLTKDVASAFPLRNGTHADR
jgi:ubiquinone/menaquinone biosynthesis C-methylase UbiE